MGQTDLVVYTTVFGNTDPLHEPHQTDGVRFVCFTDQDITSRKWEIIKVQKLDAPSRECRKLKQPSHVTFPEAEATIWMDCCFTLAVSPRWILRRYQTQEIVAFRHPKRKRISDEAQAIIAAKKARPDAVLAQLRAYQADGWDTNQNPQRVIHNGGFILRRHTPAVRAFNEMWHEEVQTRTLRDQMSIDYVAHKVGITIHDFPGTHKTSEMLRFNSYKRAANDF